MKKYHFLFVFIYFIFFACSKDEGKEVIKQNIIGYVQKGPYLNGTTITLYELTEDLAPTGKSFTTHINDNKGSFDFDDLELESRYVELMANGFYFNETGNANSAAQLTLFALTDLKDKSTLNVNVLSHLEKRRVEHLISEGMDFGDAKNQAQSEILQLFEIEKTDMPESESLDISKLGDENGILLALSVILQGCLPEADLSELLANIGNDMKQDGNLDDNNLGVALINNASILKTEEIRNNLTARYQSLGMNATVPEFEKFIVRFIENTKYDATNLIRYPSTYNSYVNLISDSSFTISSGFYAMAAYLPVGRSIKVVCKPTDGIDWGVAGFDSNTGKFEMLNHYPDSLIFTATGADQMVDTRVLFPYSPFNILTSLDFYIYENDSETYTRFKTVRTF